MAEGREILTIGHSTHPVERFVKLLAGHRVELLCDVRRYPASRRNPQFNQSALEATLTLYRDPPRAFAEIPALSQLTASVPTLRDRAERMCAALRGVAVRIVESEASVGGGAFPTARIPSIAVAVAGPSVTPSMPCPVATKRLS